nr:venom polypeptide precursor [Doratifera vulnerans]
MSRLSLLFLFLAVLIAQLSLIVCEEICLKKNEKCLYSRFTWEGKVECCKPYNCFPLTKSCI